MMCSFFRMTLSRDESVPMTAKCALNWFGSHAKIQLNSTGVEIRDYVSGLTVRDPTGQHRKNTHQAPPLPVDVVIALEGLVTTAHTLPLRVFAGVVCLCVHGVKRWSDVQHVLSMTTCEDGLMVQTYKSKKREYPVLWGALRDGFDGDWASPFAAALAEAHLPREDYLVLRPTSDFKDFTNHPAMWADANRALHSLLVMTGMDADTAVLFTLHSARHVYPTCAFQLLFPPAAVTLMGHWAVKEDKMASIYDGHKTATELAYKANVCNNVQRGWRPVPEGTVPQPAMVPLGCQHALRPLDGSHPGGASLPEVAHPVSDDASSPFLPPSEGFKGEVARNEVLSRFSLPEHTVQVLNTRTVTVHLSGGEGTWCNAWKCGSKDSPASSAEFARDSTRWTSQNKVAFCRNCHSLRTVSKMGGGVA